MDQQQALAAYGVLKNQSTGLDLQKALIDSNNQILEAQKVAEKNAILGKLTDLLMEGVESDYKDPVFLKKIGIFLTAPNLANYQAAVLGLIGANAPSVFPLWINAFKKSPIQEGDSPYGDLRWHPLETAFRIYDGGWKQIQGDPSQAFAWAKEGGELGLVNCMAYLSYAYIAGVGCERNYEEGEKWSIRAAEKRHPIGITNQAELYWRGLGRTKNCERAKEILEAGLKQFPNNRVISRDLAELEGVWTSENERERALLYSHAFRKSGEDDHDLDVNWREYIDFKKQFMGRFLEKKVDFSWYLTEFKVAIQQCKDPNLSSDALKFVHEIGVELARRQKRLQIIVAAIGFLLVGGVVLYALVRVFELSGAGSK